MLSLAQGTSRRASSPTPRSLQSAARRKQSTQALPDVTPPLHEAHPHGRTSRPSARVPGGHEVRPRVLPEGPDVECEKPPAPQAWTCDAPWGSIRTSRICSVVWSASEQRVIDLPDFAEAQQACGAAQSGTRRDQAATRQRTLSARGSARSRSVWGCAPPLVADPTSS